MGPLIVVLVLPVLHLSTACSIPFSLFVFALHSRSLVTSTAETLDSTTTHPFHSTNSLNTTTRPINISMDTSLNTTMEEARRLFLLSSEISCSHLLRKGSSETCILSPQVTVRNPDNPRAPNLIHVCCNWPSVHIQSDHANIKVQGLWVPVPESLKIEDMEPENSSYNWDNNTKAWCAEIGSIHKDHLGKYLYCMYTFAAINDTVFYRKKVHNVRLLSSQVEEKKHLSNNVFGAPTCETLPKMAENTVHCWEQTDGKSNMYFLTAKETKQAFKCLSDNPKCSDRGKVPCQSSAVYAHCYAEEAAEGSKARDATLLHQFPWLRLSCDCRNLIEKDAKHDLDCILGKTCTLPGDIKLTDKTECLLSQAKLPDDTACDFMPDDAQLYSINYVAGAENSTQCKTNLTLAKLARRYLSSGDPLACTLSSNDEFQLVIETDHVPVLCPETGSEVPDKFPRLCWDAETGQLRASEMISTRLQPKEVPGNKLREPSPGMADRSYKMDPLDNNETLLTFMEKLRDLDDVAVADGKMRKLERAKRWAKRTLGVSLGILFLVLCMAGMVEAMAWRDILLHRTLLKEGGEEDAEPDTPNSASSAGSDTDDHDDASHFHLPSFHL